MKNNNQPIVRKITGRALRVNLRRNFFITTAIALTAFMIASVFSVGMGYYRTVAISPFRFEGTRAHMGMIGHTPQQMEALRGLDYVRHIGLATPVSDPVGTAYLPGFETGVTMIYMDQANWDHFATPAFTRVAGRYATGPNNIMLSHYKLEAMGILNPTVGMEIPIDFTIYGSDEILRETFTLAAFYTEFVSVSP
jgi:putative ABC transport system permease protein